jgi:hypothetical protein
LSFCAHTVMNILISHPTGNRNVRAIIDALATAGKLVEFNTTLSFGPSDLRMKLLPTQIRQQCLRRYFPEARGKIITHPYREIFRMVLPQLGFASAVRHESGWASTDAVYQHFDKAVSKRVAVWQQKKRSMAYMLTKTEHWKLSLGQRRWG